MSKLALVEKTEEVRADAEQIKQRFREALAKATKQGASSADVRQLRQVLDDYAEMQLWRALRGVMPSAESAILKVARTAGIHEAITTVWSYKLRQMRDDMGYESASEPERALIEHISICWLRLTLAEISFAAATEQAKEPATVEHYDRRLSAAQKRFTRAVETLAKVRRLASRAPLFQVNIGAPEA